MLTALDAHGYPVSVRVSTRGYDAATGELAAELPEGLGTAEGPANLLCHYHDDKLWHLDSTHVTGLLRRRGDNWVFVSEKFTPQTRFEMVSFLRGAHASAQRYLDRRGLARPAVNWAAVEGIRRGTTQRVKKS
ncbi:hypothetical protein [Mycolicibacterium chubuense]|uniref:hypothetical protein n=1 Tax=Mycolicibacterium chubuense TaxID=1800 RepID=UPI001EF0E4AC|nr:hypothetical protein [Mycolicibacterium chubuense]